VEKKGESAMATVAGEIRIERPVDVVFETVADERNEPRYNPLLISVDMLTDEPVGAGTRRRWRWVLRNRVTPVCTSFQRDGTYWTVTCCGACSASSARLRHSLR
jgi:hypothetical protein